MESLAYGNLDERRSALHHNNYGFFDDVLELISNGKDSDYTIEQLQELDEYNTLIEQLKSVDTPFKEKFCILQRQGPYFIHKLLKPLVKQRKERKRKDCPYPGCYKICLLQLHSHLRQVHQLTDKKERQKWLDAGRIGRPFKVD